MKPVLIGTTEAGFSGLPEPVQARIAAADHVIAARRFHTELPTGPQIEEWPTPFGDIFSRIEALQERRLVLLTTGDPLWYGAGASILARLGSDNCEVIPAVSGFQMAAIRMGWPLAGVETLTIHGRPLAGILPRLYPRARLLVLTSDGNAPGQVAELLTQAGFGAASMSVLAHIGGDEETRLDGLAASWAHQDIPDFHILAVDCADCHAAAPGIVLPDAAFENSGKLTKRDARADAVAKLAPFPGATLWDIGCGSGAIAIDFLRNAPHSNAHAIDRDPAQLEMAKRNAAACGVPHLQLHQAALPDGLGELPQPDAIFIGGGLSEALVAQCQAVLPMGGILVAHCVTIESEAILTVQWQKTGGDLIRLAVHHADPIGGFHGWRPLMPVTQWHWVKQQGRR